MSWPLDAPEPDADSSMESPALDADTPAGETNSVETEAPVVDAEAAPKTRRRAPRARKTAAASETAAVPDLEAPVVETPPAPEPARRRGRRKATADVPAAEAVVNEAPASEAAATEAPVAMEAAVPAPAGEPAAAEPTVAEPARRRGRRKTAAPETPSAAAVSDLPTPPEIAPSAEPAAAAEPVEAVPSPESAPAEAVTPRRPRRRRGVAVEVPPPLPIFTAVTEGIPQEAEAPAEASAAETEEGAVGAEPAAPAPLARRRRGRRGAAVAAPTDESAPEPVAAEASDEEAEPRKRRRRGRRRRGQDEIVESVELADLGEPVAEVVREDEEEAEDEEIPFPQFLPPPVYVAPPLVPPVLSPSYGMPLPRTTAAVSKQTALPRLLIGEQSHAPYLLFVNTEAAEQPEVVASQVRAAAANGIHLFSSILYLPFKNARGERSFQAADALVQQILDADPDAYLIPRLQFVPTNYWARTHPDQMARYADGSEGDASLASTDFWADCVDALESLIAHFADPDTPGGDRVIGLHLDRGEWFYDALSGPDLSEPNLTAFRHWLQAKYQFPYALRASWYDGQVTFDDASIPLPPAAAGRGDAKKGGGTPLYAGARDGRWVDYALYSSEIVAQVINGLAAAVKTLSAGRMLVAVSYGYLLEFCTRSDSGHLALAQVLASPDVDIVAGPNAYGSRAAGAPGAFSAPLDSVALHGKLWLVEDDTKTFLAEGETPDTYNPQIVSGGDTQAAHQRHFGAALAHNAGVTWMDLWGQGWLDSPDIWRELGGLRDQAVRRDQILGTPQTPEVALIVDEASLAYLKSDPQGLGKTLVAQTRDLALRAGASVGFYLQSDIVRPDFPDAKLYLFVNALRVTTAERLAIRERLQRAGKTLAWLYAPALFDEKGAASQESSELVGMVLRLQPWNTRAGSQLTDARHPITDRLRGQRRVGQEETLNPSFAVIDPQATVLAEYAGNGAASLAVREHAGGWKSVFIGDPHLSLDLLRGLYAYAGVTICDPGDDVVYAGDGALLVHATSGGPRSLSLPRKATVYDAMEQQIVAAETRTFRTTLRPRSTRLFLYGEAEKVQAATGLDLPARTSPAEAPILPPPPQIPTPAAPPLSEPASEIAARFERAETDTDAESTLIVSDLEAVLEMEDGEPLPETEDGENASEETPRPRSRWQRRRAAARARREAERQARAAAEGTAGAATPPVDISALLPDLPPRRPIWNVPPPPTDAPTTSETPSETLRESNTEPNEEN